MKFFGVLVINLILLVQISQSHTVPPTIIAKSEPNDDDVLQVNQDDNTISEVFEPIDVDLREPTEPTEPPVTDENPSTEPPNEDELVFAHVVSPLSLFMELISR